MTITVLDDPDAVARAAASLAAADARAAVEARGRFTLALSGGRTPALMLRALSCEDVPWNGVYIAQVDERVAPEGHADRNLTLLRENLLQHAPVRPEQVLAMPVDAPDLPAAAVRYARALRDMAGAPPLFDLVHLGLGADGHTASLVPGDLVLEAMDRDVALTGPYQGRRRMTLTYPLINRARRILWLVTGADKARMLARLRAGDRLIPAGRVRQDRALLLADRAAAGEAGA